MIKKTIALAGLLAVGVAYAASDVKWGYTGENGAENWAKLTPEFAACNGKNQSPINLEGFIEAELKPIEFNYQAAGNEILNNGHTIQVNYADGSSIKVDGVEFALKQFHFHAPSENHIRGKSYPLEVHFVHADKDGNLAVVAVMFEAGEENAALAQAWAAMPTEAGAKTALKDVISAEALLPESRDYYRFNGSLTTPPCSEGVRWLVMKNSVQASQAQIDAFSKAVGHANNRPIQAINARPVLQ